MWILNVFQKVSKLSEASTMESAPILTDYIALKSTESEQTDTSPVVSPVYSLTSASPLSDDDEILIYTNPTLFPIFDALIRFLPTYYTNDRNRCINMMCLCICFLSILSMPIYQLLRWIDLSGDSLTNQSRTTLMENIFIFIVYFFPFCSSLSRLWFFAKYFTLNLWHYPPNSLNIESLPHLLRSNVSFRRQMIRQHRFGFSFLLLLSAAFCGLAIWDAIEGDDDYQTAHISIHCIQFVFGGIPDVVMICVVRLYLIHCSLSITAFIQNMNRINTSSVSAVDLLDEMLQFKVYQKYLGMQSEISSICRHLRSFIVTLVLAVSFIYWFVITMIFRLWFFTDWTAAGHSGLSVISTFPDAVRTPLYLQFTIFAVYGIFAVLFMLWPAFGMNLNFSDLKEIMDGQIEVLTEYRTHFHDERILREMTANDGNATNGSELRILMEVSSKQKSCLEMLTQTRWLMNGKPCTFKLFGVYTLNKAVFRDFAVILLMVKVMLFLWYGIN